MNKTSECCAACGAPTAYGLEDASQSGWWNRVCQPCRQATWDSYLGPVDEKTYQHTPAAGPLPGAPWTAAMVEQAQRFRLLDDEGSLRYVSPEEPLTTVTVVCSHAGRGKPSTMIVVAHLAGRWLEDVTPSAAKTAQWLNAANPALTDADRGHTSVQEGGTVIGGRKAFAIRATDGWLIETGPARGRSSLDLPGRDRRPALMGQARIRYKDPEMTGVTRAPDGSYDLDHLPGHIELACRCGLSWRCGEGVYGSAFDKLAAAGIERVELAHLVRFAA